MTTHRSTDSEQQRPQESLTIGIAEYQVTTTGAELSTHGLGSCVGVSLFDQRAGVAGLIHIKRPSQELNTHHAAAAFADSGIELLVEEMVVEGAVQRRLEAKMAGGSDICSFTRSEQSIGDRNVAQATATLDQLNIEIVEQDTGGDSARSLYFDGETGILRIKS